jgi:YegS/Rv2252/BmrU family lipid kinase
VDAVTKSRTQSNHERKDQEWHAIVNPASGGGRTRKVWPPLAEKLRASGVRLHQHETGGVGDATVIAQRLVREGAREIVVVGGDGTLNEVINGVVDDDEVATADVVLSLIPCGTGKDFARSLGITSPEHALDVLTNGVISALDLGSISYQRGHEPERRFFVNVADVGLGAETAAWMNRSSKRLGGFLGYLVAATRTIVVFSGKPARVLVDDVTVHDGPVGMVVLANGRFFAGGMRIAPNASLTDGLIDVLILDDVPKYTLLGSLLPKVYRGKHLEHSAVHNYQGSRIEISAPESMPFEVDGEQPGFTDIGVCMRPGALKVRTPAPAE